MHASARHSQSDHSRVSVTLDIISRFQSDCTVLSRTMLKAAAKILKGMVQQAWCNKLVAQEHTSLCDTVCELFALYLHI